jgi:poly-gamma-glutamate synthesis protein (capsule biosynthesis protein)
MDEIKIAFVGDIFPGGVLINQEKTCDDKVMDVLMSADLRVATLECALGPGEVDGYSFDEEKMARPDWRNIFWAPNECINRLKELHIDVVTIANNHIFDLGEKGLINTIRLLDENGIKHCGAGANMEEASKPAMVEINGKKIAFLGYMPYWWEAPHPASEINAGINHLHIEKVEKDVIKSKEQYDYVFVLPHWGIEHTHYPTNREREFALKIINAGADGIIGSHTHMIQPLVKYKGIPVFFSLGNFLFPDYYISANRPVCYPKVEEITSIPSVFGYPKYPERILKCVWKPNNRVGAIYQMTIANGFDNKVILTQLSQNNVIVLYQGRRLLRQMSRISCALRSPLYRYYLYYITFLGKCMKIIKK